MLTTQGSNIDRRLVCYYSGEAADDKGRYLAGILEWPDEQLELVHDFIQWMFPLTERGFNLNAPLLDRSSIDEFQSGPQLQHNLRISFLRMLKFYGLEMCQGQNVTIRQAGDAEGSSRDGFHRSESRVALGHMTKAYVKGWKERSLETHTKVAVEFESNPEKAAVWETRGQAQNACRDFESLDIRISSLGGRSCKIFGVEERGPKQFVVFCDYPADEVLT